MCLYERIFFFFFFVFVCVNISKADNKVGGVINPERLYSIFDMWVSSAITFGTLLTNLRCVR